jgi:hypothetical protein
LDNVWEQVDENGTGLANQYGAEYLMMSSEERKLMEYNMIVIKPKNSQQQTQEDLTGSKKRSRDILEEMNKTTPSQNVCYEKTERGFEPITEIVKGKSFDDTPMKKISGPIHREVNEDSTSFKHFLGTEFKKNKSLNDEFEDFDSKPHDRVVTGTIYP